MVTDATRAPMERWVRELKEDPELVLPPVLAGARVLSAEQLAFAYLSGDANATISQALKTRLGMHMRDLGFELLIAKVEKAAKRLWLIDPKLNGADPAEVVKEFNRFKAKV